MDLETQYLNIREEIDSAISTLFIVTNSLMVLSSHLRKEFCYSPEPEIYARLSEWNSGSASGV
jgi:hypothetical protein